MSIDNAEEKRQKEVSEAQKTTDSTAKGAVITGAELQKRWRKAQEDPNNDQLASATDLFQKPEERGQNQNKFVIDGLEDEPPTKIAYDLNDLQRDWNKGVKQAESLNPERLAWVHRGHEDEYVDYEAALQGFKLAGLDQYPHVSKELVAAAIRNEQHFYKPTDEYQDREVREKGTVRKTDGTEDKSASIGPAQIQISKIKELVTAIDLRTNQAKYPFLNHLKSDPIRGAQEPRNAALLVAAYFADSAEKLKAMKIEPSTQALAYTYNPDVFKENGNYVCPSSVQLRAERQLPAQVRQHRESVWNPVNSEILNCSVHVKNVGEQLRIVKANYKD